MGRILTFLLVAFLFWLLFRSVRTWRRPRDDAAKAAPPRVETIAQCAWCGVHVAPLEAVALPDGRAYCCDAHRDAARQAVAPADRRPS